MTPEDEAAAVLEGLLDLSLVEPTPDPDPSLDLPAEAPLDAQLP
jgi:hypothetical protein